MKYCRVTFNHNTNSFEKSSRFFNTLEQATKRCRHVDHAVKTKKACIELGIFKEDAPTPIVTKYPMEFIAPLKGGAQMSTNYMNKVNWERYISFCSQNGYAVPI